MKSNTIFIDPLINSILMLKREWSVLLAMAMMGRKVRNRKF